MQRDTIKARVYNHKAIVVEKSGAAYNAMIKALTITDGYYLGDGTYKITKKICYYDKYEDSFPTPMLDYLADCLDKQNIDIEIEEHYKIPPKINLRNKRPEKFSRRAHQLELIDAIHEGERFGFHSSPTATGKQQAIVDLIDNVKVRTIVSVPTTPLRNDMLRELKECFGPKRVASRVWSNSGIKVRDVFMARKYSKGAGHKIIDINADIKGPERESESLTDLYLKKKGYKNFGNRPLKIRPAQNVPLRESIKNKGDYAAHSNQDTFRQEIANENFPDILVVCNQGLAALPSEVLDYYGMIIYDEGHTGGSESNKRFTLNAEGLYYRFSVSATNGHEIKLPMLNLISVFGTRIIYEDNAPNSVYRSEICEVTLENYHTTCAYGMKDSKGRYIKGYEIIELGIVANDNRNQEFIVKTAKDIVENQMGRVLVEVCEEDHIYILKEHFDKMGLKVYPLHSTLNQIEKNTVIDMMKTSKEPYIVLATSLARQGIDTVTLSDIILAGSKKSMKDMLQWIGRLQRINRPSSTERDIIIKILCANSPKIFKMCEIQGFDFEKLHIGANQAFKKECKKLVFKLRDDGKIYESDLIRRLINWVSVHNPEDYFHKTLYTWSCKRRQDFKNYYIDGMNQLEASLLKHKIKFSVRKKTGHGDVKIKEIEDDLKKFADLDT